MSRTEQETKVQLLNEQEIQQAQYVINGLYDLLESIKETKDAIADAFDSPVGFFVEKIRDKFVVEKSTTEEEVADACKAIAEDSKEELDKLQIFLSKLGRYFPRVHDFVSIRIQKLGQNAVNLMKYIAGVQKVINLIQVVGPYISAIIGIVNKILGLFGGKIPLVG